jgi:hypothetical protein
MPLLEIDLIGGIFQMDLEIAKEFVDKVFNFDYFK